MPTPDSIGQRFTQLIQHLGLSKNAFAQSLDKTATVIQHLVDERNKPGYDLLCKVFDTYPNVSKDWLMLGDGPMMKPEAGLAAQVATVTEAMPIPAPAINSGGVAEPAAVASPAPVSATPIVEVAAQAQPVVPLAPALAPAAVAPAPIAAAPPLAPAPDPAYFTVALQTQYLQHQLALAEQRNQHLLEQQALMQQMVALLQRAV